MVFSAFASKILYDMVNRFLEPEGYDAHYSEVNIKEWLKGYEWLLEFDPCRRVVDDEYVAIHPHNLFVEIELNIYQYTLLQRAVKYYLDDKVDLSRFISIKEGWL